MTEILIHNARPEFELKRQTAGASGWGVRRIDLTGQVFGDLTVVAEAGRNPRGLLQWTCRCSCGADCVVLTDKLRSGRKKNCGCLTKRSGGRPIKHGHSRKGAPSATYAAWCAMVARCHCPATGSYARYGGIGIAVCTRWRKFDNFLADMGECPPDKRSPDRINNGLGYQPGNVRWASMAEQARNRRNNKITYESAAIIRSRCANGETKVAVARDLGVSRRLVANIVSGKSWS